MRRAIMVILLAAVTLAWNPGDYPGVYNSGASLLASGVIWGGPQISSMGVCEFYNSAATAQFYIVYNSPTVAGQAATNIICGTQCQGTSFCSCLAAGPTGPRVNAAIQASKGMSWAASSTFPAKAATSANSWALCTFNVNP